MEDIIICRCEEVTLQHITETATKYKCSAREVKLRTRAGMGFCGGRTCRPAIDTALATITGETPGHDIPLKVSPPIRPVSLAVLGGKSNE
ncbi:MULTISPECIES: (2Fe-2S)-binding protein [unclassified Virgibacillus]|uniref:(2Fe-2S)-binding protein n=1 Tax=unclassified Virgibacillus TaxID=2620237 RepID=UPI0024DE096D|nr:(2Fe-2S)-binding protein [Virgibacillus sp. LDC-1]